jgi:hypothetical protein
MICGVKGAILPDIIDIQNALKDLPTDSPPPKLVSPNAIDKAAEELRKRTELPKKPGQRVQFREMKDWINLLTPEMREQVDIYVYRLDPPIIRQKSNLGNPSNIEVISDRLFEGGLLGFEQKYLEDTQGGGRYQLIIKNQGYKAKAGADNTGYFECFVTIPFSTHPPKLVHIDGTGLDLREVNWEDTKAQSFKAWAHAHGYIDKDGKVIELKKEGVNINGVTGNDAMVQAMKLAMDFASKMDDKQQQQLKRQLGAEDSLGKSIGDILLEKMKQEDPNKNLATMTTLLTAMKSMQPEVKPDNTMASIMPMFMTTFTTLIGQMQDSSKQQFAFMMKMLEKPDREEKETNKIDELKSIIELAREIKGGGVAHERSTAEVIVDAVAPIVGPVLNIVGNIIAMNAAAKGVKPMISPDPNAPQPRGNMATLHQEHTVGHQQPNPTPGQPSPPPQLPANEAANMIAQYGPIIVNKLAGEGWEFGAWVADGFGDPAAAAIVKYGPENLLQAAKMVPQFWSQIEATYGEAHLKKWLESLCNYKSIMQQMDAEEEGDYEEIKK